MQTMTPSELHAFLQDHPDVRSAIVDVRTPAEFAQEHIEGSINIPLDTVLHHTETLREYERIFLYCRSGNRSGQACTTLQSAQIPHSTSIEGGLPAMAKAGFAIVKTKSVLPLQQQVLLGAGSIVVTGLLLGWLLSPWFQLLSLGAGGGLMFAGLTGNCMLANLLSRMPWNRS